MSSYDEFRVHYDIEASAPDSRAEYSQYNEAHVLMAVVGNDKALDGIDSYSTNTVKTE